MKHWAIPLKILFTILLFWGLFTKVDVKDVWRTMLHLDWRYALFSAMLVPLGFYLESLKWQILIQRQTPKFSLFESLQSVLIGTAGAITTPLHIGKYAAQVWFHHALPKKKLLVLVFINGQILGVFTLLFGLASLSYFFYRNGEANEALTLLGLFIVALVAIGCLAFVPKLKTTLPAWLEFLFDYAKADWTRAMLFGFLRHLVSTIQFCLLINACLGETPMPFELAFIAVSCVWISKAVMPFFIGDLGLREATAAYFVSQLGFNAEAGVAASLLIFTMNLLLPAIIGLAVIPKLRFATT